jgi:hypothetical protein
MVSNEQDLQPGPSPKATFGFSWFDSYQGVNSVSDGPNVLCSHRLKAHVYLDIAPVAQMDRAAVS